jgi:hypothetical protein
MLPGGARGMRVTHVYSHSSANIYSSPKAPTRSVGAHASPLDDLLARAQVETEVEVPQLVDAFCEEHVVTMEMLEAVKESSLNDNVLELVASRLTSHYLGVVSDSPGLKGDSAIDHKGKLAIELDLASKFEASVVARKAESVLQLIGRKTISPEDMHTSIRIPEKSDAVRILDVLMAIDDCDTRRAMLGEAFDDGEYEDDEEEEGLWTTPMVLYQAIEERLLTAAEKNQSTEILEELKLDILKEHLNSCS